MEPVAIHHVAIVVADLQRSLQFYRETLGVAPEAIKVNTRPGLELAFVEVAGSRLELLCYHDRPDKPQPGTTDHVAFEVDDIEAAIQELVKDGVVPAGSQPRGGPGAKVFFYNGPDGERLELFQPEQDVGQAGL